MKKRATLCAAAAAIALCSAGSTPAMADSLSSDPQYSEACFAVANAKFQQWQQRRIFIDQTRTFADGTTTNDKLIVTENTAYARHRGSWKSAGASYRARDAISPEKFLANMGLAACTKSGTDQIRGHAATTYTYTYKADAQGFAAHGSIAISDETGLPLREDMQETAPPANPMVATTVSATYLYNSDSEIPAEAENAESSRLFLTAQGLRHMQGGVGGGMAGAR